MEDYRKEYEELYPIMSGSRQCTFEEYLIHYIEMQKLELELKNNADKTQAMARSAGTTIKFLMSESSDKITVHFDGNPSDNDIDRYFETKCGGVYKWWR